MLIAAAMLTAPLASGRQLTPSEAFRQAASQTDEKSAMPRLLGAGTAYSAPVLTGSRDGLNTYYVFAPREGGYVVAAADDCVAEPLLAFSDSGRFDSAAMPPAMQWLLDSYSAEIAMAAQGLTRPVPRDAAEPRRQYTDIAPICTTKWNQDAPYNDLCPKVNGQSTYVGCVATAMAQIMKVHNWPERGRGVRTFSVSGSTESFTVDFSESVYDWENMPNSCTASSPSAACTAVARLSYDCGVAVDMMYGTTQSGAYSQYIASGLYTYFDYDIGMEYAERDYYYLVPWIEKLYSELEAGRPVCYSGSTANGAGHQFVLDGFRADGNYFHVNWGWGGMSDGYFLISVLTPDSQGIGGADDGFNFSQSAVTCIQPPVEGSEMHPVLLVSRPFSLSSRSYSRSTSGQIRFFGSSNYASIANMGVQPISVSWGVQLTNKVTGEITYLASTIGERTYGLRTGVANIPVNISSFPQEGEYEVRPAYCYNGVWHELGQKVNSSVTAWNLTATPSRLDFTECKSDLELVVEQFEAPADIYSSSVVQTSATITAAGAPAYANLVLSVSNLSGTRTLATLGECMADLEQNQTLAFDLAGYLSALTGISDGDECRLVLSSADGGTLASTTVQYHLNDFEASTVNITFANSTNKGTSRLTPARFPIDNFEAIAEIECTKGYFSNNVIGMFASSTTGEVVGTLPGGIVSASAGQTTAVRIHGDTSGFLRTGTVFMFSPMTNDGSYLQDIRYIRATTAGIDDLGADIAGTLTLTVSGSMLHVACVEPVNRIIVCDMSGRTVADMPLNGVVSADMPVACLPAGAMVVSAVTDSGRYAARAVITK